MNLFEAVFEAVDREAQRQRLLKLGKVYTARTKAAEKALEGPDESRWGEGPAKTKAREALSTTAWHQERLNALKKLLKARKDLTADPENEKHQRALDNAKDALASYQRRVRPGRKPYYDT